MAVEVPELLEHVAQAPHVTRVREPHDRGQARGVLRTDTEVLLVERAAVLTSSARGLTELGGRTPPRRLLARLRGFEDGPLRHQTEPEVRPLPVFRSAPGRAMRM